MTHFYKIVPWDIPRLTLFQWQDYMEKLGEIYKFFHPETKSGTGATAGQISTAQKKRLIRMAKEKNIKLPKKGI